jgi:hypothetical protein
VDTTNHSWWVGYDSTRTRFNADANRPTIKARSGSSTQTLVTSGNFVCWVNLILDGDAANTTAITGFSHGSYSQVYRVHVKNCEVFGITGAGPSSLIFCSATGCSGTAAIHVATAVWAFGCESYDNTTLGFRVADSSLTFCLAHGNSGASTDGISAWEGATSAGIFTCCTSYGNGRSGFNLGSFAGRASRLINCLAYGNGGEGYRAEGVKDGAVLLNCFGGNNTSGNYNATNLTNVVNFTALSADPFMDVANDDFSLNTAAGGGAAVRAAGLPGVFPKGLTTGYLDGGAVQHADPAGGDGGGMLVNGGLVA